MIELLVRLEDELYEQCKNTKLTEENEGFDFHIIKSVANGTPLPKGHGRLIDADAMNIHDVSPAYGMEVYGVTQDDIEYEPTIIESDKGE